MPQFDQETEDRLIMLAFSVVEANIKIEEIRERTLDPWLQQRSVRFGRNLRANDLLGIVADAQSFCDQHSQRLASLVAERTLADVETEVATEAGPALSTAEHVELAETKAQLKQVRRELTRVRAEVTAPVVIEAWRDPDVTTIGSFNWEGLALALRQRLGDWALIRRQVPVAGVINAVRNGSIKALPKDEFEVTTRNFDAGPPRRADLYLRYLPESIRATRPLIEQDVEFVEELPAPYVSTTQPTGE